MQHQNKMPHDKGLMLHRLMLTIVIGSIVVAATDGLIGVSLTNVKYVGIFVLFLVIVKQSVARRASKTAYFIIVVTFLLFLPSAFFLENLSSTVLSIAYSFFIPVLAVLGYRFITSKKDLRDIGVITLIIVTLVLLLSTDALKSQFLLGGFGRMRLYGNFNHPNQFASITVTAVFFLTAYLATAKVGKRERNFCIACICCATVLTLASDSRTAIVCVFVFLILVCLQMWSKGIGSRGRMLASVVMLLAMLFSIGFLFQQILLDANLQARLVALRENNLEGVHALFGYGMLDSASLTSALNGKVSGSLEIAWASLLYKSGLLGVISTLILFGYLFVRCSKDDRSRRLVFFSLLAAILLQSFGESFIVNITNYAGIAEWILLSYFSSNSDLHALERKG